MAELSIQELKDKIIKLESMGETDLAGKYKQELARKENSGARQPGTPIAGDIVLGVSAEEFEKSGSKFPGIGLHMAIFDMPFWKTPGKSLTFSFVISEGSDENKASEFYAGVSAEASWKIKEVLTALGVAYKSVNNGNNVSFNPADVAGKQGKVLFTQQPYTKSNGMPGTVIKPAEGSCVYPAAATLETIGMTLQSLLIKDLA